ncbi:hypothetical protein ABIE41_003883 [Bosea sp. OAE506]|uniref:hypothetical protein n=1 Tax=Bosea sp. OAE506 TaxID=2663870 RepID=UPI00178ADF8D
MGPLGHELEAATLLLANSHRFTDAEKAFRYGPAVRCTKWPPLVAANDPLPAETIAAATLLCHRTGDFLMRASALSGALQRPDALARSEVHLATMRAEMALLIRVFEQVDDSLATLRGLAERSARIQAMQAGANVIFGRSEAQTRESQDTKALEPHAARDARGKPEHDAEARS